MQIFSNTFPSNKYYIFLISFAILFSCNSFQGTSISKNSLEILIVSNENCKQLEEFKNHFFLPQKAITETELTGNLYNVFDLTYIEYTDFTEYFHGYQNIVFLLWGGYAKQKLKLIDETKHYILTSGHPSPLSANRGYWFGNKHFSKTNAYLIKNGKEPIDWGL